MAITERDIARIEHIRQKKRNYIEWYGMKKALLAYVGLPRFFPLKAHLQHGAGMIYRDDQPDPGVLGTKYKNIFLCNRYQADICEKYLPRKNIYVVGSIFPLYRKQQGIIQDESAEGSLFFTAHSSEAVKAYDNIEKTLNILNNLPDYLKPIKVSIYYTDLLRGLNKIYEDQGYETFTSGHRSDTQFVNKFYQILKSVKYAIGTTLGSQTYYAVEMDIPYIIIGDPPELINEGNEYYPKGTIQVKDYVRHGYAKYYQARSLFVSKDIISGVAITPEQRTFVRESIGDEDKISNTQLKKIILKSFLS